jgi:hypothetical protein
MKLLIKCILLIAFTVTVGLAAEITKIKYSVKTIQGSQVPGLHFNPPPPPPPPPPPNSN